MSYTNAWYIGNAELEGETACFCASLKSIPAVLSQRLIAATTWSWKGVVAGLACSAIIDARSSWSAGETVLRGHAPTTVGIGPRFVAGSNVDLALDTAGDGQPGDVDSGGAPLAVADQSPGSVGIGGERFVRAGRDGRFFTQRRIADSVRAGDIVGHLHAEPVTAPCSGVLRGLSARGARVHRGHPIVEVDSRGEPALCYGIGGRARRIGAAAVEALSIGDVVATPHYGRSVERV